VAGLGGAIGCLIAFKIVVFIRLRYEDAILQFANKDDEKRKKQFRNLRALHFFLNTNLSDRYDFDQVIVMRAVISSMVSISLVPTQLHAWTSLLIGMISGAMFIGFLYNTYIWMIDDATYTSQVHGFSAIMALFIICFFDKDEGFLFKNISK